MFIDIVFFSLLLMAIFKGYSKGLIRTVFSFLAIILGIVIAFKFSSIVANEIQKTAKVSSYWLPFISFTLILIVVIIAAKIVSSFFEKVFQMAFLGWLNKLCGITLYTFLYMSIFSGFLFFLDKMNLVKPETLHQSKTLHLIKPIAPFLIDGFGTVLPFIKDSLHSLETFFKTNSSL